MVEEIQKNLMAQISSMAIEFEEKKKEYESQIEKLKSELKNKKEKDDKNDIQSGYDMAENKNSIIKDQLEATLKMQAALQANIQSKDKKIKELEEQNGQLKNENEVLNQCKTQFVEEINKENEKFKELEKKYDILKGQFDLVQKQKEKLKEKEENLENEIEKKDKELEENKTKIEKLEENNKDLLQFVKNMQEKEKEEEKKKKEIELKLAKEKEINEEMKKKQDEKNQEINKMLKENENKDMDQEAKDKFLTDILCEFLLKLNNSQYFISVFELLENCLKHYDELKFFKKMDALYGCPLNHTLYNFFGSFSSYISISNENISLSDFLSQKFFKYSEINKNDVELIKRISSIKISKDIKILDLYRKKKEVFFKSVNLTFDLLKNKIINDEDTKKMNLLNDKPDFLQTTKPPKDLTINFNEINIYKFGSLVDYQIYNIFPKLEKLKMITSDAYLPIFYSLILNFKNLSSFEIISTSD